MSDHNEPTQGGGLPSVTLQPVVGRSRDQLSDIARKLEQAVFPISDARGQHLAHAIAAIRLGQGLLRDVPANPRVDGAADEQTKKEQGT